MHGFVVASIEAWISIAEQAGWDGSHGAAELECQQRQQPHMQAISLATFISTLAKAPPSLFHPTHCGAFPASICDPARSCDGDIAPNICVVRSYNDAPIEHAEAVADPASLSDQSTTPALSGPEKTTPSSSLQVPSPGGCLSRSSDLTANKSATSCNTGIRTLWLRVCDCEIFVPYRQFSCYATWRTPAKRPCQSSRTGPSARTPHYAPFHLKVFMQ